MLGPMNFVANLGVSLLSFWAVVSLTDPDPVPVKSTKVIKSTIPRAPIKNLRSCTHGAWPVFEPGTSAMIWQFFSQRFFVTFSVFSVIYIIIKKYYKLTAQFALQLTKR